MEPHKLKVKAGIFEFEGEGDPKIVQQQYDEFKILIGSMAQTPTPASAHGAPSLPAKQISESAAIATGSGRSKLSQEILSTVFQDDEPLTLMVRPKTAIDGLLVLIYGHTEYRGNRDVTASAVKRSAEHTGGISIGDLKGMASESSDLILWRGVKKGTRYWLTSKGRQEAEKLIKELAAE